MTNAVDIAKKYFNVVEKEIPAEYKKIKKSGFNVNLNQYYVEGIGNLAIQNATMFGLMKIGSTCITPIDRDLPLFSYDIVDVLGKRTFIIEMYDVMLEKDDKINNALLEIRKELSDLPEDPRQPNWYDDIKLSASISIKGKKSLIADRCDDLYAKYLDKFFSLAKDMNEVADKDAKRAASDAYVQGLIDNGGPSTEQFIKLLGKEGVTEYYKKHMFGTI